MTDLPVYHHVVGEPADIQGRLQPKKLWNQFANDTLAEARMHAVDTTTAVVNEQPLSPCESILSHETFQDIGETLQEIDVMPETGSLGAAIFGIIKGTVGPAILYLPRGFQVSGYGIGASSMIMATMLYVFNAYRLLDCWKVEKERDDMSFVNQPSKLPQTLLSYPELARRAFGSHYAVFVDVAIAGLQLGVCLTYLIFVPHNLFECFQGVLPKELWLILMLAVEVPLGWIQDIRTLTTTNVVATVLIVYGLVSVIWLAMGQGFSRNEDGVTAFQSNFQALPFVTERWFLFVGTSFFMMEGSITLLVPLQESITRNSLSGIATDGDKFPRANETATTGIVLFYIAFSMICCVAFGDSIQTAMTASLYGVLATTIQLAYSVAVIFTFPLQAFPAMEVLKINLLGNNYSPSKTLPLSTNTQKCILSTIVIGLLGVVAVYAIDYLGNVVSILGSLFGIPLALVIPPLMHNTLVHGSSSFQRYLNYAVVVVGVFAMGAASFATLSSWDEGAE